MSLCRFFGVLMAWAMMAGFPGSLDRLAASPVPQGEATYRARLSAADLRNSNGAYLPDVENIQPSDILLQERMNFHQGVHRDPEDTWDVRLNPGSGGSALRAWLREEFTGKPVDWIGPFNGRRTKAQILEFFRSNPVVDVRVGNDKIIVREAAGTSAPETVRAAASATDPTGGSTEGSVNNSLVDLLARLEAARRHFDAKPKVDMAVRPVESPYEEYEELVDASHDLLLAEQESLLAQDSPGEGFDARVELFVKVAANAIYLDPGQVCAEIVLVLKNSGERFQRKSFNEAVKSLDRNLRLRFIEALEIEERGQREGNGG